MSKPAVHFDPHNTSQAQPCCRDCPCKQAVSVVTALSDYARMGVASVVGTVFSWLT